MLELLKSCICIFAFWLEIPYCMSILNLKGYTMSKDEIKRAVQTPQVRKRIIDNTMKEWKDLLIRLADA